MQHALNGTHDHAIVECLELGETQDRWSLKRRDSEAAGVLTVFHSPGEEGKEFNGWDWEGCPSLVKADKTATEALQEMIDCVYDEYPG